MTPEVVSQSIAKNPGGLTPAFFACAKLLESELLPAGRSTIAGRQFHREFKGKLSEAGLVAMTVRPRGGAPRGALDAARASSASSARPIHRRPGVGRDTSAGMAGARAGRPWPVAGKRPVKP